MMRSAKRSLSEQFTDLYTYALAFLCFIAIATSMSFSFRSVRGSYGGFTLDNSNAVFFFMGALLICCSLLCAVIRALGPVGYSAGELFWRFPGIGRLPKNPWKALPIWGAVITWALLAVLLATIFAPLSTAWLIGTVVGAILYGLILILGLLGAQVLNATRLFAVWAVLCSLSGTFITFCATTTISSPAQALAITMSASLLLGSGALLSIVFAGVALRRPLSVPAVLSANGRRTVFLAALTNLGTPQGYTYFGSPWRFLRRRLTSSRPVVISLAGAADSWGILGGIFVFVLPLGIFLSVAWGSMGAVLMVIVGCWFTATLMRWLCREWTAQRSLRSWIGGSYVAQLMGFSVGPAAACALLTFVWVLVFSLPLYTILIAFLMGAAVAWGDSNPSKSVNYDLTITTAEGILIPFELMAVVLGFVLHVGLYTAAVLMGPVAGTLLAVALLVISLWQHHRPR